METSIDEKLFPTSAESFRQRYTLLPRIRRSRIAMMAITSRTWMIFPRLNTKAPSSHPMIRITAMMYRRSLIKLIWFNQKGEKRMPTPAATAMNVVYGIRPLSVEFLTEYVETFNGTQGAFPDGYCRAPFFCCLKKNDCYGYTVDRSVVGISLCAVRIHLLPFNSPALSADRSGGK
jgi:hypothetical protein